MTGGELVPVARELRASRRHAIDAVTVRSREADRTVIEYDDIEPTLMNCAMMEAAQREQVRRFGLAAIRPVLDVVHVDIARVAASGETATLVACGQQTAQRG